MIADSPPGAPVPPILPPKDGHVFLDRERFPASFAGDLPQAQTRFMADSQVLWGVEALNGAVGEPAWRTKSTWYLVAADDRIIPPPAQRAMAERAGATVSEAPGSHSIYVSQPKVVVDLIRQAAAAQVASWQQRRPPASQAGSASPRRRRVGHTSISTPRSLPGCRGVGRLSCRAGHTTSGHWSWIP
ncbi:alpha/beta hydrolase [Streptomyces sp. NPDC029004]|uniref:alpha/beta hydrolase n=1 Tax=Streptomyces sp. NPDC029004 TaxID=3154490 RepID=UPI0033DF7342